MKHRPPTIALLIPAGSAAATLAGVAEALHHRIPDLRIVPVDIEALVYDAGRRDEVRYGGPGDVANLHAAPGLVSRLVSRLRRLPRWTRPILDSVFGLVRAIRPVAPGHAAAARRLFAREAVDLVLTCNDVNTAARSLLYAARSGGARTVLLQEGSFCTIERRRRPVTEAAARLASKAGVRPPLPVRDTYGAFDHDLILAASDDYARRFRAAGATAPIRVAGVPRFDQLGGRGNRRPRARPRLLYIFQPFLRQGRVLESGLATIDALIDGVGIAAERTDFDFAIKTHPRADPATIERLVERSKVPLTLVEGGRPLQDELEASDVAIGHYSTGLLEALVLDLPIVCVPLAANHFAEPEEAAKQAWFVASGVPSPTAPSAIATAIVGALGHRHRNLDLEILEMEAGPLDARATARSAEAIGDLLQLELRASPAG